MHSDALPGICRCNRRNRRRAARRSAGDSGDRSVGVAVAGDAQAVVRCACIHAAVRGSWVVVVVVPVADADEVIARRWDDEVIEHRSVVGVCKPAGEFRADGVKDAHADAAACDDIHRNIQPVARAEVHPIKVHIPQREPAVADLRPRRPRRIRRDIKLHRRRQNVGGVGRRSQLARIHNRRHGLNPRQPARRAELDRVAHRARWHGDECHLLIHCAVRVENGPQFRNRRRLSADGHGRLAGDEARAIQHNRLARSEVAAVRIEHWYDLQIDARARCADDFYRPRLRTQRDFHRQPRAVCRNSPRAVQKTKSAGRIHCQKFHHSAAAEALAGDDNILPRIRRCRCEIRRLTQLRPSRDAGKNRELRGARTRRGQRETAARRGDRNVALNAERHPQINHVVVAVAVAVVVRSRVVRQRDSADLDRRSTFNDAAAAHAEVVLRAGPGRVVVAGERRHDLELRRCAEAGRRLVAWVVCVAWGKDHFLHAIHLQREAVWVVAAVPRIERVEVKRHVVFHAVRCRHGERAAAIAKPPKERREDVPHRGVGRRAAPLRAHGGFKVMAVHRRAVRDAGDAHIIHAPRFVADAFQPQILKAQRRARAACREARGDAANRLIRIRDAAAEVRHRDIERPQAARGCGFGHDDFQPRAVRIRHRRRNDERRRPAIGFRGLENDAGICAEVRTRERDDLSRIRRCSGICRRAAERDALNRRNCWHRHHRWVGGNCHALNHTTVGRRVEIPRSVKRDAGNRAAVARQDSAAEQRGARRIILQQRTRCGGGDA